jgi:hypothetical protein
VTAKIVLIPQISLGDFPFDLPAAAASNCGGYILPSATGTVYAYSPIDLCVAGVEAMSMNIIVTDLYRFFLKKRGMCDMLSEHYTHIGVLLDGRVRVHNVAEWRMLMHTELYNGLHAILRKNAPLTFN